VVEGTGLENRQGRKLFVGSNPTPSARVNLPIVFLLRRSLYQVLLVQCENRKTRRHVIFQEPNGKDSDVKLSRSESNQNPGGFAF
jgi:hypothetical protein